MSASLFDHHKLALFVHGRERNGFPTGTQRRKTGELDGRKAGIVRNLPLGSATKLHFFRAVSSKVDILFLEEHEVAPDPHGRHLNGKPMLDNWH